MSCGGGELGYTSEPHESRIKVEWFYERQFTTATNIFLPLPYKKRGCGLRQISARSLFLEISTKNEYVKFDNPNGDFVLATREILRHLQNVKNPLEYP